jgi:hypothetical protein
MRIRTLTTMLTITLFASACATSRSIQPIVFQGPGFDQVRYQADLADCHRMVESQSPGAGSAADVAAKTVGGALLGATAGAILGAVTGHARQGAVIGTAAGSILGGAGGYGASELEKRMVYHQAVTSCLALKGYQVLGATGRMR